MQSTRSATDIKNNAQLEATLVSHRETTYIGHIFKKLGLDNDSLMSTAIKTGLIVLSILLVAPGIILGLDYLLNAKDRKGMIDEFIQEFMDDEKVQIDTDKERNWKKGDRIDWANQMVINNFEKHLNGNGKLSKNQFLSEVTDNVKHYFKDPNKLPKTKDIINTFYPTEETKTEPSSVRPDLPEEISEKKSKILSEVEEKGYDDVQKQAVIELVNNHINSDGKIINEEKFIERMNIYKSWIPSIENLIKNSPLAYLFNDKAFE